MTRFLKNTAALALLVLVVVSFTAPDASARKKPWEKFKYDDLGEIKLPEYERVVLDNGMVLYLAEDHELPLVELSATISVGSIYEPVELTGLASITGEVLRTGGTAKWTGDEIDAMVENMGAFIETGIGASTGQAFLSVLKEDTDRALEILAEVLMHPRFDEEKLELSKTQHKAGIARRNDEPMGIAFREFRKVMFGPDHPMARIEEYATLAAIERQHLVDFHDAYVRPDRMYLVVVGDFVTGEMIAKIEGAFAGWEKASRPLPADPEVPALPRTVNVAAKDGLSQSIVIIGYKGIRNDHEHYAALQVANQILGGGFSSRLFNEIRSNRGLAYTTGSNAGTGWRNPGLFVAFVGTKNETAHEAVSVSLDEIRKMTTDLVTDKELSVAVDGILNGEVFNFDTKREILDRQVLFEMYGYPETFLDDYRVAIQGMTAEKVRQAADDLWKVDDMSILVVGNPDDFEADMDSFGVVNDVDITIPEPEMVLEVPDATPESLAAGQELMAAAAKAVSPRLSKMKGFKSTMQLDLEIQGMAMSIAIERSVSLPNRMKMSQKLPFGEMTQVLNGDKGSMSGPMGNEELAGEQLAGMQEEIDGDLLVMLRNRADLTCQALEPVEIDGVLCERVYVTGVGEDYRLICLDQATMLPFMEQSKGVSPMTQSPVEQKVTYSDWKEMGGAVFYGAFTILHDGEVFADGTTKSFELNPSFGAGTFE